MLEYYATSNVSLSTILCHLIPSCSCPFVQIFNYLFIFKRASPYLSMRCRCNTVWLALCTIPGWNETHSTQRGAPPKNIMPFSRFAFVRALEILINYGSGGDAVAAAASSHYQITALISGDTLALVICAPGRLQRGELKLFNNGSSAWKRVFISRKVCSADKRITHNGCVFFRPV